jgi:hypothetical protein
LNSSTLSSERSQGKETRDREGRSLGRFTLRDLLALLNQKPPAPLKVALSRDNLFWLLITMFIHCFFRVRVGNTASIAKT